MNVRALIPAAGLLGLAALALVGDVVLVALGHQPLPALESVFLAGLTGGAALTPPPQRTEPPADRQ
ncbi:hypothetical protein AB0K51_12370 [Kitasatospora sp. NPDC049285]|uniref:hypothetical protein n=1 Tax=Kitasatospora sp. NPDC049285 TaxID=3157096 RepID=UPI00343F2F5D